MTIEITKSVACCLKIVLLVSMSTFLTLAKIKEDNTLEIFCFKKFLPPKKVLKLHKVEINN